MDHLSPDMDASGWIALGTILAFLVIGGVVARIRGRSVSRRSQRSTERLAADEARREAVEQAEIRTHEINNGYRTY
ncbi:hypothetical protein [Agromyces sp. NPDC058110]|uniref:hypothetical protein n=1 Tax=Agromyces sp. NPDC058110 TaxID=3346345 RepID=UPI0036DA28C3